MEERRLQKTNTFQDSSLTALPPFESNTNSFDFNGVRGAQRAATEPSMELAGDKHGEAALPSKEAVEKAAAARFISQVDNGAKTNALSVSVVSMAPNPRLGSNSSVRDSILNASLSLAKSKLTRTRAHSAPKRSNITRPPPLQLSQVLPLADEISSPLPERTSSKGAPSFDLARPTDWTKSLPTKACEVDGKSSLPLLTPQSATSFHFDFSTSIEPRLSRSASVTTTASQSPLTPPVAAAEDHLRKGVETFALDQGSQLHENSKSARTQLDIFSRAAKFGSGSSTSSLSKKHEMKPVPSAAQLPQETGSLHGDGASAVPLLRRKKSMFRWLPKKTEVEVDDLIDLYLTDEQLEQTRIPSRKASRPRMTIFRNRVATDPLPVKPG